MSRDVLQEECRALEQVLEERARTPCWARKKAEGCACSAQLASASSRGGELDGELVWCAASQDSQTMYTVNAICYTDTICPEA